MSWCFGREAAMFFRIKKSGTRSYIQIVENKRINGAVRQSVIANLGRADDLNASGALASLPFVPLLVERKHGET
jgi:hypothetical protein